MLSVSPAVGLLPGPPLLVLEGVEEVEDSDEGAADVGASGGVELVDAGLEKKKNGLN